jgi:hypothetical protein
MVGQQAPDSGASATPGASVGRGARIRSRKVAPLTELVACRWSSVGPIDSVVVSLGSANEVLCSGRAIRGCVGAVRDDGRVSSRLAEPDYQLVWPRALFVAEAAKLLNQRGVKDWDERCELLLEHAFVRGYEGGPVSEFREIEVAGFGGSHDDPWGTSAPRQPLTTREQFLRDLMGKADQLQEDTSHRRPYWRERKAGQRTVVVLDNVAVVREYIALVGELDDSGYFEKRFGKDCVDDERGDVPDVLMQRELDG